MSEEKRRAWSDTWKDPTVCLPFIAILISVFGFWLTNYQFYEKIKADQQAANKQNEEHRAKEFRLRFYEKQLNYLVELSDAVSRLASAKKPIDCKNDFEQLERMYFGQIQIMGNETITSDLRGMLHIYAENMKNPEQEFDPKTKALLIMSSAGICRECRFLLEKTFELDHLNHGELPKPIKHDWKH